MKYLLVILFHCVSTISFGQIEKQINSLLLKKDFNVFLQFAYKYKLKNNNIIIVKGNIREITEGFQEAMFYISKSYQMDKGVSITCEPKLKMITRGNQIIYFFLESKEIKNFPRNYETTSDTTYKFTDKNQMIELKNTFERTYKSSLKQEDLFVDTIAFGNTCGHYPGETTIQHEQILNWVRATDTLNLYKWLQSANTEKQVYAIKGLYFLRQKGVTLTEKTKALIRLVANKKGTIYTCIPCDRRPTSISTAVKPYLL